DSSFGSNVSYIWNTGSNSASITADSTALYFLDVEDEVGCAFSDSIYVEIDSALFNIDLGKDTSLCKGNSIGLLYPNNKITSYSWSTGSLDSSIFLDSSQTYILTVSSYNCSFTDSIKVDMK